MAVFLFVPVFTTSRAGTFILGFLRKGLIHLLFNYSFMIIFFIWLYLTNSFSRILLIVRRSLLLSRLSSIFSTIFSYASGKFDRLCVIIYVLSICTLKFLGIF